MAEDHINSVNRDGWFPFLLQVTAILQTDEEIFVCLLDGAIYESGSFGGFLIYRLLNGRLKNGLLFCLKINFYVDFDTFCRYQINYRKTEIGNSLKIPILKLTFP